MFNQKTEKMKIKINETIKGIDGIQPLHGEGDASLTLKDICINALLTPDKDDDEKKKIQRYEIFKKLRACTEEAVLTTEEISVIKRGIGKINVPLIVGQAFELLEENHA